MKRTDKVIRILILFYRLSRGEDIEKIAFTNEYGITERSFDRDIKDIRVFLSEIYSGRELLFDKQHNVYHLSGCHKANLAGIEILVLLKILISSRAFRKDEMDLLIKSMNNLIPDNKKVNISKLMCSEMNSYIPPQHKKAILKIHWDLEQCVLNQQIIELNYYKANGEKVQRRVSPIAIIFSEHYFYLLAFRANESYEYPAFFRLDRIESFILTHEKYTQKILEKYDVGAMKNCIQFMYAGDLLDVKLKCLSSALEALLDRLPNAEIIEEMDDSFIVKVKIFSHGFIRWVLSQGKTIEVLEPLDFREKVKNEIINMLTLYPEKKEC